MNRTLEGLIDEIVEFVDDEIFDLEFSKNSPEPEVAEDNRDVLRELLEEYVESHELLTVLRRCGVEDWDGWDDAIAVYGKPIYE